MEQVLRIIPLGRVLRLGDDLAVAQIGDLHRLLVRNQVLVVLVGDHNEADYLFDADTKGIKVYMMDAQSNTASSVYDIVNKGTDVTGQFNITAAGTKLVFDLLAGEHDLAVHAFLRATLGGFADDVLLDRRHIPADPRFVRRVLVAVTGQFNITAAGTKATVSMKADALKALKGLKNHRQYTLLIPGVVNMANGKGAAQVRKDFSKQPGDELTFCETPANGTGSGAKLTNSGALRVRVEQVIGLRPIILQRERGGRVDQIRADDAPSPRYARTPPR